MNLNAQLPNAEPEPLLHALLEAAANGIVLVDSADRITLTNAAGAALFGYSCAELIGRPLEILIPARHEAAGKELVGRRKDGTEVSIQVGMTPIDASRGLYTVSSVTPRGHVLESAHELSTALIESADDAILTKTLDGTIRSWNAGAERLLGYLAHEIIGQPINRLLPADRLDEEIDILARIKRGERVSHFETKRKTKAGAILDVSLTISPIRTPSGQIVGASKIMRDITTQKDLEFALRRSNEDLEQFAYIASHDLQEPLRMVASYTTLLAQRYKSKLDEKADKYIFYAVDGAKRMQQLITDLLEYSRVGSQGRPLVPVSSQAVVESVLDLLRASIQRVKASVEVGSLPVVLADEGQLRQLFQNVIGNAIKFRSEGAAPRVRISATLQNERWVFSISDNGIGLDMRYANQIFQMFTRLHERGAYEGSGIGLAIAKRIVERHRGNIWLESECGTGTTVLFTLLGK